MHHALSYLLGSSLVPELCSDISAGSSCNIELVLIIVATVRAYPNELVVPLLDLDLSVVTADLAVIGLGVELGIHDVVVDELHDIHYCIDIVLHVGNFNIRDSSAGRESLELALELKLLESIDLLSYVNVVAVGDVVLVSNALDDSESSLKSLGKLICCGLERLTAMPVLRFTSCPPW